MVFFRFILCVVFLFVATASCSPGRGKEDLRTHMAKIRRIDAAVWRYYVKNGGGFPDLDELRSLVKESDAKSANPLGRLDEDLGKTILYETSKDKRRYVIATAGRTRALKESVSAYLYDVPRLHYFDGHAEAIVVANGCDRSFPGGYTAVCEEVIAATVVLRNIKDALQVYLSRHRQYPDSLNIQNLEAEIKADSPPHELTDVDMWGNEIFYVTSPDNQRYLLASPGKDGKFTIEIDNIPQIPAHPALTESLDDDIMIVNGQPVLWPRYPGENVGYPF